MRITQNRYFNDFITNQQNVKEGLNSITRQISSGMKIKYGYENPSTFTDTLRLDYEETTLNQAVNVSTDAQNFANNTDSVMFQFTDALTRYKTLMIQAANGTNGDSNYFAISNEMKSLKEHLINLSNSSIDGRFLFSGTATNVKPVDSEGNYKGNGDSMKAVAGADVEVPYNIPGKELFLGEDSNFQRSVTTNIAQIDTDKKLIAPDTAMKKWTGSDNDFTFTINGRKSDGEIFKTSYTLHKDDTISDLLKDINDAFGSDTVDVSLKNGLISVEDKIKGSSFLDFNMSATDGTENIYFMQSQSNATDTQKKDYDQAGFKNIAKDTFRANMPQMLLTDESYATLSTKLQDTTKNDLSGGKTLEAVVNGTATSIAIDNTTTFKNLITKLGDQGVNASLDSKGRLVAQKAGMTDFKLYDNNDNPPSILFNTNNALTIDDPKHDLFSTLDSAINAVKNGWTFPDGEKNSDPRNIGIENGLAAIDHVLAHVDKEHTKIGAMSNSLKYTVERSQTLKLNVQTLRSGVLDTDIGEATMKLNQLSLNYQAMMATVAKVQKLSLVNYL